MSAFFQYSVRVCRMSQKYDLPEGYRSPIVIRQKEKSSSFGHGAPDEGCAFWIIEHPAKAFFFNEEKSPSHTPKSSRELLKAILDCTVSPDEYQKIWDNTLQACRKHAETLKDKPDERDRFLKAAEAKMPKEDVGKYICRVVYTYPKKAGTMTTYIRMTKEELDQVRKLLPK
jgi:hypothetical protein